MSNIKYFATEDIYYYSPRYRKEVFVPKGYPSDGATGALDIDSISWWIHDLLCDRGTWEDGTKCTNWQASMVLYDILKQEGRWFRKYSWKWATFLFGGGLARKNGMFKVREK